MIKPELKILKWNPHLKDKVIFKVEKDVFILIDKDTTIINNKLVDKMSKKIKNNIEYCIIKKKGQLYSMWLKHLYDEEHFEVQQDLEKIKEYFELKRSKIKYHKQIIELGYEAEDLMNWRKSTISINREVDYILKQMKEENIPFDKSYSYVDENKQKWEMEYALQFLDVRKCD